MYPFWFEPDFSVSTSALYNVCSWLPVSRELVIHYSKQKSGALLKNDYPGSGEVPQSLACQKGRLRSFGMTYFPSLNII
jgi:hypothetical protein